MRAAFIENFGGPEVVKVGAAKDPSIKADEVLVRVHFAALNHLDIWVRRGLPGLQLEFPHILGGDAAGKVETKGNLVTGVEVGDEVIIHPGIACLKCESCLTGWESLCAGYRILGEHTNGTHAEYVVVPGANLFKKPTTISFSEAAAVPLVFTTAWQMVKRAGLRPGQWVLVHAAGSGVSTATIQIARLFGTHIITTAGTDEKLKLALELGAEYVINYQNSDWTRELKKIRKGGVDVIFDHIGQKLWEANIRCLRWGGKLITCGATTGAQGTTDLAQVFYRQLSILGSTMGSKGDFPCILTLLAERRLRAVIDKSFPLNEARKAHERLEKREQFGKILLEMN